MTLVTFGKLRREKTRPLMIIKKIMAPHTRVKKPRPLKISTPSLERKICRFPK